MKARAAVVGRRLALGTWLQLETWARWLGGTDAVEGHRFADFLRWLGVVLRRVAASIAAAVFYGLLLQRVPGGIYALPVVWAIGAWQMSDTSATPPPREVAPDSDEAARHRRAKARVALDPNGVMCIMHEPDVEPPIEEPEADTPRRKRPRLQALVHRAFTARGEVSDR